MRVVDGLAPRSTMKSTARAGTRNHEQFHATGKRRRITTENQVADHRITVSEISRSADGHHQAEHLANKLPRIHVPKLDEVVTAASWCALQTPLTPSMRDRARQEPILFKCLPLLTSSPSPFPLGGQRASEGRS